MNFYCAGADLLPILLDFEEKHSVQYVLTGNFEHDAVHTFGSCKHIPQLGKASSDLGIGCDAFLVIPASAEIVVRKVNADAAPRYCIDQLFNPGSARLIPAGLWKPNVVVEGVFDTAHKSEIGRAYTAAFRKSLKRFCTKIRDVWVGPVALEVLRSGGRLTQAVSSSSEYDLRGE